MGLSFHVEQWVPRPVEEVFSFFADPRNLLTLMPEWQKARIEQMSVVPPMPKAYASADSTSTAAGKDTQLTLSFRPFPYAPFRVRWVAEICAFAWNNFFCDCQITGPFSSWRHCHHVRDEVRDGIAGTLILDDVEYAVPYDALGQLAHRYVLRQQIERNFAYRQTQLAKIFGVSSRQSAQQQQTPR